MLDHLKCRIAAKQDSSSFYQLTSEVKCWNGSWRCVPAKKDSSSLSYLSFTPLIPPFLPSSTLPLHPPFHESISTWVRWGSSVAQVCCRQRQRDVWVKLLWTRLFNSIRLWLKHWPWPFSDSLLFSLTNGKAWSQESESTCSRVPAGLRRDRQACQQATWNTWVGTLAGQRVGLLSCFTAVWISYLLFCPFTLD